VFTIFVPPLRERKADLLLLVDHFLEKFAREHRRSIKRISTPAIDMLTSYHWPGNVRELENTLERSVLMCDGEVIHGHHLAPVAADRRSVRHGDARLAEGCGVGLRKRSDSGCVEDHPRQLRESGPVARHHRADRQLQSTAVRD
jgi:DNA-binding NtrC family response regulator